MISEKCFSEDWLNSFKEQEEHRRIDRIILEKMIYALHLLEGLKTNGLDFVFKGGTSLVLLLEEGNRFSIDIDIICKTERQELEAILKKVVETSKFSSFELEERRSYLPGVPKAYYSFAFDSVCGTGYSGKMLLDILIETVIYPEIIEKAIETKWIETESKTMVNVPSIDAIAGDKLTAFSPRTIGIPYFKGKQPFAMEICKQLFDLGRLFDHIQNMETVAKSFLSFAQREIAYLKIKDPQSNLTPKTVLQDTIDTCMTIAKRGAGSGKEKTDFSELQKGIKAFGTGFLMTGNFRIDEAIIASARVAYLASKIIYNNLTPVLRYEGQYVADLTIADPNLNFLNRLKKQPDRSSFFYWFHSSELLAEDMGGGKFNER